VHIIYLSPKREKKKEKKGKERGTKKSIVVYLINLKKNYLGKSSNDDVI
jgi:hypothetical protein